MSEQVDVAVIGAGFTGIYALHKLREQGLKVKVLEAGNGIGGTWYWNSYPGARCDVESFQYSYSFDDELQQEWQWSERYASQPEIRAYLQHVVDRFNLNDGIQLNTAVRAAHYDENNRVWKVTTNNGDFVARYIVTGVGCLSQPKFPDYPGLEQFKGRWIHTGHWPEDGVELKNKKVAVIGTGSSGVQVTAEIASEVEQLTVFQRTPHWVVLAGNRDLSEQENQTVKARYADMRAYMRGSLLGMNLVPGEHSALEVDEAERNRIYQHAWDTGGACFLMSFNDLLVNPQANRTACDFLADKIRSIVKDSKTAEALIPDAERYPLGGRRMVQDDRYYATYNRDNVSLVATLDEPIECFTEKGIKTVNQEYEFDVIILATGFDAMTGALLNIDIQGRNGIKLKDKWHDGPQTYMGIGIEGFPNLYTVTGPGSPSVLSNMALSIEQHVDWISDAIQFMEKQGLHSMEPSEESEKVWAQRVIDAVKPTVLYSTASLYNGSNIEGKPKVFTPYLGGVGSYRDECDEVAKENYRGFVLQ